MFPIRDINRTQRTPVVTWALIAINIGAFLLEFAGSEEAVNAMILRFGVVPDVLVSGDWAMTRTQGGALGAWVTPVTSMFLHGGVLHLLGNMWFLHLFGDNVEDVLGRLRFVLFYVACGLGAVAAQVAVDPDSTVPMIGASGAISGVLAGYVLLFPKARIVTVLPFLLAIHVPALVFIVLWFAMQVISGLGSLAKGGTEGGVAWFAHVGGFVAGLGLMRWMRPARQTRTFRR